MSRVDEERYTALLFEKYQQSKRCYLPKDTYNQYIEELKKCQVTRGRGDPRNLIGVIMDVDENDLYTIGELCNC